MDRRHPHRPFQSEWIRPFLKGREIVSVQLLAGGKSNTNYKIKLDDGNTYVLRLYSRTQPGIECYVMGLVEGLVPTPTELYRGDRFSVFSFLPGRPLEEVPEFSKKAAKALARIASVSFASPGKLNADGTITPWPFAGLKGFISRMIADERVCHWIGNERITRIKTVLEKEAVPIAELDAQSQLVHGDFNPGNILIHDGEVSGVLDWEFSFAGTPYIDIGNLLRNLDEHYHADIYTGLAAGGMNLPQDWKKRAQMADLSSHLEFLTSNRADAFKRKCVAKIDDFFSKFPD
ncbi:MAG: aminoglycoside phosphotransferase family protein [Candidatus Aminicenantes bacterium]|nr:MAG: aminoglycoside phosphotransferase family protein [Candidatus Aminicenantes bacterium]